MSLKVFELNNACNAISGKFARINNEKGITNELGGNIQSWNQIDFDNFDLQNISEDSSQTVQKAFKIIKYNKVLNSNILLETCNKFICIINRLKETNGKDNTSSEIYEWCQKWGSIVR